MKKPIKTKINNICPKIRHATTSVMLLISTCDLTYKLSDVSGFCFYIRYIHLIKSSDDEIRTFP